MTSPLVEVDTVEVLITSKGHGIEFVAADGVTYTLRAGQRAHLPVNLATRLARVGQVEYLTRVRALKDSVSAGSACDIVLMKGDIAPCSPDRAARLVADGVVQIVTERSPVSTASEPPAGWVG